MHLLMILFRIFSTFIYGITLTRLPNCHDISRLIFIPQRFYVAKYPFLEALEFLTFTYN